MIELGKRVFSNNPIQLIFIFLISMLSVLVQKLSSNTINHSLTQFISASYDYSDRIFNLITYITLPSLLFILSTFILIWLGITNFMLYKEEDKKIHAILRIALAIVQTTLFCILLYLGGKVFFFFLLFLFIVFYMAKLIFSGLSYIED